MACLRQRPGNAVSRLRQVTGRRPADLEVRLLLAELELAMGDVDRAIAEAGIAIQLAPPDLRGMTLLLRAQARSELQAS
jgi:Flp pilus assembly protein TadD